MAIGKFSQQVIQSQGLPSRTERRKQEAFTRNNAIAERNFNELQQKAKDLQNTEFSNITSASEYRSKYNALSSDLKQFFITPEEVDQRVKENRDPALVQRSQQIEQKRNELKKLLDDYNSEIQKWSNIENTTKDRDTRERANAQAGNFRKMMIPVANEYDELGRQLSIIENSQSNTEATQRLSSYSRQMTQATISQQENQRMREANRVLAEATKGGYSFMKVEESQNGVPLGRKIYAVTPSGEYKLVSESKAQKVSNLKPSAIPMANITEVVRIGNTEVTFQGVQDLYKTPQGKLATAYGSFDITEDAFVKQAEEERRKAAEEYLASQNYNPVISVEAKKQGIFSKIYREVKILYDASFLGVTSAIEREGDVKRKFFKIGIGGSPSFPKLQVDLQTLDTDVSQGLIEDTEREEQIGQQQFQAIQDLTKVVQGSPEELQYDVQQLGLERLKTLGVDYTVDEKTGDLIFTSKEIIPRKSFGGIEFSKATGFKKVLIAVDIAAIKGAEVYYGGELIGGAASVLKAGYYGIRGAVGVGEGFKITEIAARGKSVVGTAEYIEQTALAKSVEKAGGVLKTTAKGTVIVGLGGLYIAGGVSKYFNYKEIYGDKTGRELFIAETVGEVAGFGALIGKTSLANLEIKRLNEQIKVANFQKEIKFQRLQNIKLFGQFSSKARVEVIEGGTGKVVLSKSEKEILQGVYVKQAGFTPAEAERLIKEGAIYEQKLIVESPADFEAVTISRKGIVSTVRTEKGFKEIAVEFSRNRGKISNAVIKTTTGTGKYGITSVFEKTRRSKELREILKFGDLKFIKETPATDQFRLKDVFISKVGKQGQVKIGDLKYIAAEGDSRLLKSISKKIKDRTTVEESLRSVKATYSEKDLAKMYERAGVSARISPTPFKVLRIEQLLYRGQGVLKVNTDEEFGFIAAGGSGRQVAIKNILKDIDFKAIAKLLETRRPKKTPFSVTFADETQENVIKNVERQILKQVTKVKTKQVMGINLSPTITSELKVSLRQSAATDLKSEVGYSSKSASAVRNAIKELLGVGSVSKVRQKSISKERTISAIKSKVIQKELLKTQQRQRQQQTPQLRSQTELRLQRIIIPTIPFITTTPPYRPTRTIVGLGKENKKLKNMIKLKKILQQDELALFPTFTSKALDIPAITVSSEKEALRLIKQMRTGFEITGGVRIRK